MTIKTILSLILILTFCLPAADKQNSLGRSKFIEGASGLIVLSRKYSKEDFISIYNADGSIWHRFTFYYDDSAGQFPYDKDDFYPFAFHPDYFLLALKCVRKVGDRYEVIVNEVSGLKKYIINHDPVLTYEDWNTHVLKAFSVEFDDSKNPLCKDIQGKEKKAKVRGTFFHPVRIEGDWLEVKWEVEAGREQCDYGWIKWKEKKKLLVELYYFA